MEADPKTLTAGGVLLTAAIALVTWLVKKAWTLIAKVVNTWLDSHKRMVEGALDNMRANTRSIDANAAAIAANTEATLRLVNGSEVRKALELEREKAREKIEEARDKKLDKIESDVKHIRIRVGSGGC